MRFAQDDSFDGGDAIVLWDVVQRYEKDGLKPSFSSLQFVDKWFVNWVYTLFPESFTIFVLSYEESTLTPIPIDVVGCLSVGTPTSGADDERPDWRHG